MGLKPYLYRSKPDCEHTMGLIIQKGHRKEAEGSIYLIRQAEDLNHEDLQPFKSILDKKLQMVENGPAVFYTGDSVLFAVVMKVPDQDSNPGDTLEELRAKGSHIFKRITPEKLKTVSLNRASSSITPEELCAFAEGMALSSYQFLKYKSEKKVHTTHTLLIDDTNIDQIELDELNQVIAANFIARDLGNEPVNALNSLQLAAFVENLGRSSGFETEILHKQQIQSLRMGGLLGVNAGSSVPPTFSIMTYKPRNAVNADPFVFIGKGVTYDTGGYSIKTGGSMPGMKMDMSGAGAVIGAMHAIAVNKLPVYVIAVVPATDNRINADAIVPDDIITMHDGTTVEVLNTDAEGRLILGDALSYVKKYNPALVIDLATLTGAAAVITGSLGSAMMGTDKTYTEILKASGENTFERVWEIPYWKEYADMLKSDIADLKNIGGAVGGSATAGKFLEHFTDYPWIHLDIAGPAILKEDEPYKQKGASGVGVRLLYHFIKTIARQTV